MAKSREGKRRRSQKIEEAVREEFRRSLLALFIRTVGNLLHALIKWGTIPAVAWAAAWAWVRSVEHLGGEETSLSILVDLAFDAVANKWFYWLVIALLGGSFGVSRKTYQKRLAQLASQKKELERLLDSERSSSRLNKDATTEHD